MLVIFEQIWRDLPPTNQIIILAWKQKYPQLENLAIIYNVHIRV